MTFWLILAVTSVGVLLLGVAGYLVSYRMIEGHWPQWPFGKKKRMRRYVLNAQREMPSEYLLEILKINTPVISQREYAKLPPHLQKLFVPSRKS